MLLLTTNRLHGFVLFYALQVGKLLQAQFADIKDVDMAPDEYIILTALKYYGLVTDVAETVFTPPLVYPPGTVVNCYPTAVRFPSEDSPHPVTWSSITQHIKYLVS
jgi:hypothetical protein